MKKKLEFKLQRFGFGRYDADTWASYKTDKIDFKSTKEIFSGTKAKDEYLPKYDMIRESCDSEDNPNSTPIIIACDVSGSMTPVLDKIIREELPEFFNYVYERKPVSDPHLMFMGVGDYEYDNYPLQVTQFEADIRIAEQLSGIYLEEGGGGNNHESYLLPLWFAKNHTKIDSYTKRKKKGYIFTMGDELPQYNLNKRHLERMIVNEAFQYNSLSAEDLLTDVSKEWNVYHLLLEQGYYARRNLDECRKAWKDLYGQHVLYVSDIDKLSEIITSTIQIVEGEEKDRVIKSWDGSTALVVQHAIQSLENESSDLVEF